MANPVSSGRVPKPLPPNPAHGRWTFKYEGPQQKAHLKQTAK